MSHVREDQVKVERQESDCRELCARRGWDVAAVHVDNRRSAWRRDRQRPGWDALLAGVADGRYGAIVVWHGDRLLRQPADLERLIEIAESRGIRIASIAGERDLDSPDDRYILRIEAASACRSSDDTQRRVLRGLAARRDQGLPNGARRSFGFTADGAALVEDEAEILREVARRLVEGADVRAVCRDLERHGIVTADGVPFSPRTIKRSLIRPAMVGQLVHHDQIIGTAAHGPVLDEPTWYALRQLFGARAEVASSKGPMPRHLLSGIARCGTCDSGLYASHYRSRRGKAPRSVYRCIEPGCERKVTRGMTALDELVIGRVLERFAGRTVDLRPEPGPDRGTELSALESRREQVRDAFSDVTGEEPEFLRRQLDKLDGQIDAIRAEMASAGNRTLDGLTGIDRDAWDLLTLDRRRAVVRDLFTIRVLPAPRGPGFDPAYVDIQRKGS